MPLGVGSRDFGGNFAVQDGVELSSQSLEYLVLTGQRVDLVDPRVGGCVKVASSEVVFGEFDDAAD